MDALLKKLNYKGSQPVVCMDAPESFIHHCRVAGVEIVTSLENITQIDFGMAFCTRQAQVDEAAHRLAPLLQGDAIIWFCYPKTSSKKYKCDFNRDTGWESVGKYGLEPVRQVAIDEDWSALRFRKVEYIKNMSRGFAISDQAKKRLGL